MWGTDSFKDLKGKTVRQVALLLGPTNGGKSELLEAVKSLKKIGERKLSRLALPENTNDPKLAREFEKAEAKMTHAPDDKTIGIQQITKAVKLLKASLQFVDGTGLEDDGQQTIRIEDFVEKHIMPKRRKWKDGVLAIIVFNIKDVLAKDEEKCANVEATYRDVLEIWGKKIWPDFEEECVSTCNDTARNQKNNVPKKQIRPPLAVIFVASHMDLLPPDIAIQDAKNEVNDFARRVEGKARNILPLPPFMPNIDFRYVCADLKSLRGRIEFTKTFYKARKDLTERMQEQMEAQK